ncbi:hypothetical protein R3P38DRAFT_2819051 [Favolaschia claudopus]|uniref:Uncharacterized protein n=1 Tax=Favolaschia claudopus TaxID=2862362 RepID=A0AAW0EFV8_9AGAR
MPVSYSQPLQPTSGPSTSTTPSTVFCSHCGTQGEGRFCTECGTRLVGSAGPTNSSASPSGHEPDPKASTVGGISEGGRNSWDLPASPHDSFVSSTTSAGGTSAHATTAQTASTGSYIQPAAHAPAVPQESPTALFGSQGYRLDAFHYISREIFVALDRSINPIGTQMMEASKIRRFRELSGKSIPPYYETHVLPLYYQSIGAQCVGSNVLSWDGWNTFLAHKILSGPDDMYAQLGAVLRGLNIQLPWPLVRTDFPAYAYPDAAARELQFQQGIRDLAGAAMGGRTRYEYPVARGGGAGAAGMKLFSGLVRNSFLFN